MKNPFARIDALLSRFGYCSRKEARQWVRAGRIAVKGAIVKDVASKSTPHDITIDGKPVPYPDGMLMMLHKPAGYVCTHAFDEGARVYDILPYEWMNRSPLPSTIGRLDKDTTGLVLITDDVIYSNYLIHPKHHVQKVYEVTLNKPVDSSIVALFAAGELILKGEDKACLPAEVSDIQENFCKVTLHEGKYHQIKRMFVSCGYEVDKLHRTRMGPYELGDLAEGSWKEVAFVDRPVR